MPRHLSDWLWMIELGYLRLIGNVTGIDNSCQTVDNLGQDPGVRRQVPDRPHCDSALMAQVMGGSARLRCGPLIWCLRH